MSELPEVYCFMLESMDGKATGEWLDSPEGEKCGKIYFQKEYSFDCKTILSGRGTFESDLMNQLIYQNLKIQKQKEKILYQKRKMVIIV